MTSRTRGDDVVEAYMVGRSFPELQIDALPTVEDEVSNALRHVIRWLDEGTPPNEIAVVVRNEHLYLQPLADKAAEYAVPLISGRQQGLVQTPLGGLVQLYVAALRQDWEYWSTRAFLSHPLLQLPFDVLRRAAELRPLKPRDLLSWDPSVAALQLPPETEWSDALGRLESFLQGAGIWEVARKESVVNVALTLFAQQLRPKVRDKNPCTPADFAQFLTSVLRSVTLPTLYAKSAVRVVNPIGVVGREFSKVILLGLADGIFPMVRRDDPLIDSHIRRRWASAGLVLPDVTELASIEESLFLLAVGTARDDLILSYPRRDLRMQPLLPSPFLEVLA